MQDLVLILDEIHMIKILITDVELKVKVGGIIGNGFKTNTGVPQGDCLSPLLFILYLARSITSTQPTNQLTASQVNEHNYHQNKFHEILEPKYADDISWITNGPKYLLEDIKQKIPGKLEQRNLKINKDKTEEFQITYGGEDDWKKVKYLGSLLETNEDIKRRKSLTLTAISNLENIWKNRNVSTDTKYRIYKAVVESIFLYNSDNWNMTKKLHKEINSFQRRTLRYILNIKYPRTISKERLMEIFNYDEWSRKIKERRWKFFGHLNRLPEEAPARKAMTLAEQENVGRRGRNIQTWVSLMKKETEHLGFWQTVKQKCLNRDEWARCVNENCHTQRL